MIRLVSLVMGNPHVELFRSQRWLVGCWMLDVFLAIGILDWRGVRLVLAVVYRVLCLFVCLEGVRVGMYRWDGWMDWSCGAVMGGLV